MVQTWLAGKISGIAIFVLACLMPICAVGWAWEGVALHGLSVPAPSGFPLYGPYVLVDGAIGARDRAIAARQVALGERDAARKDRDRWKGNAQRLGAGLDRCNDSVTDLAVKGKAREAAAQAKVDGLLAKMQGYRNRIAALDRIQPSNAVCPSVDNIFRTGFNQ